MMPTTNTPAYICSCVNAKYAKEPSTFSWQTFPAKSKICEQDWRLPERAPIRCFPIRWAPNITWRGLSGTNTLATDKLKLTGRNLDRVFKSRLGRVCTGHELYTFCKTGWLKVKNLAQTTFRFSPVSFRAPRSSLFLPQHQRRGRKGFWHLVVLHPNDVTDLESKGKKVTKAKAASNFIFLPSKPGASGR